MNRNSVSHFSETPVVKAQRSVIDIFHSHKTTLDAGKLYPFFEFDVLPGDTIHIDNSVLCRMATPLYPVMDNCYLDTFFFYVPHRLVWRNWKRFCGENETSAWDESREYFVPQLGNGSQTFGAGTTYDHFGEPVGVAGKTDALLYRAYRLIWNEWFRNQNVQDPLLLNDGDTETDFVGYGKILPVNRFRDYFSSCLPAPQKGEAVSIPFQGEIPVYAASTDNPFFSLDAEAISSPAGNAVRWYIPGALTADNFSYTIGNTQSAGAGTFVAGKGIAQEGASSDSGYDASPSNLRAYLDYGTGFASINALRQAFQVQRMLELDARSGTRYAEILRSHFNVIAPDASLQRPEYLGGRRIPLSINQVLQTTPVEDVSPLGQTGAFSKTVDAGTIFRKSFTEHGRIIGVCCIRTDRSYQQGIRRSHSRRTRYDFYWPALAHIGEQAVLNKEIYAQGSDVDDQVFGYQEAWAEYRNHPNIVSGGFRENSPLGRGLNAWHYADWYSSLPMLSAEWMEEGQANVDRTLAVQSADKGDSQFLLDAFFKITAARPIPLYSVPGLIDHF